MSFRNLIKDDLRRTSVALLTALLMFGGVAVAATASNEGLPGDWLSRYASPYAIGMGGATVAVGGEPPVQQVDLAKIPGHHVFGLDVQVEDFSVMHCLHAQASLFKKLECHSTSLFDISVMS